MGARPLMARTVPADCVLPGNTFSRRRCSSRYQMDAFDVTAITLRYGPMVLRRCRQLLRDEDEALDACQDVFVRLLQHRTRLDARYPSRLLYRSRDNGCLSRL